MDDLKTFTFTKEETEHLYRLVDDEVFGLSPLAKDNEKIARRVTLSKKLKTKLKTTL